MITYALIMILFTAQPEGLARADVMVLDRGLTAEDCTRELEPYDAIREESIGVYACSLDYDF